MCFAKKKKKLSVCDIENTELWSVIVFLFGERGMQQAHYQFNHIYPDGPLEGIPLVTKMDLGGEYSTECSHVPPQNKPKN